MKYGSICTGIGRLDAAIEEVFGAEPAWFCEYDAAPRSVLAKHWPGVPILEDVKAVDWSQVEGVQLLCAGYPCQPFSLAGQRGGTDDPRHLWPFVADAIRVLRPRLVVLENVAGHVSLGLDVVLADLAALGFDAEWGVLRASDVGACHQRARLFIVAQCPDGCSRGRHADGHRSTAADTERGVRDGRPDEPIGRPEGRAPARRDREDPADAENVGCERSRAARRRWDGPEDGGDVAAWGEYGPAIERHARVLGRPAPAPTDERGRLSVPFVEWMQMLPEGWVDGMTRTQALTAFGNCVVTPQAVHAIKELMSRA